MSDDPHWMEKAFSKNKGKLHKRLGVKAGKRIPSEMLKSAAGKGGSLGKEARLAETARKINSGDGSKAHEGAEPKKKEKSEGKGDKEKPDPTGLSEKEADEVLEAHGLNLVAPKELVAGFAHEKEHGKNKADTIQIALEHLGEKGKEKYYTRLKEAGL